MDTACRSLSMETWQIFLNLNFRQNINKFIFPGGYLELSIWEKQFIPLKPMEHRIYWYFCSFGETWQSEISACFPYWPVAIHQAISSFIHLLWLKSFLTPILISNISANSMVAGSSEKNRYSWRHLFISCDWMNLFT